MNTVESLRKTNHKVRVTHYRYLNNNNTLFPASQLRRDKQSKNIASKGGSVEVEITTPDGRNLMGIAQCSLADNFNKKLGVRIAINRALNVK